MAPECPPKYIIAGESLPDALGGFSHQRQVQFRMLPAVAQSLTPKLRRTETRKPRLTGRGDALTHLAGCGR